MMNGWSDFQSRTSNPSEKHFYVKMFKLQYNGQRTNYLTITFSCTTIIPEASSRNTTK